MSCSFCSSDSFMSNQVYLNVWLTSVVEEKNLVMAYGLGGGSLFKEITESVLASLAHGALWLQETSFSTFAYCTGYKDPLIDKLKQLYSFAGSVENKEEVGRSYVDCFNNNNNNTVPVDQLASLLDAHQSNIRSSIIGDHNEMLGLEVKGSDIKRCVEGVKLSLKNEIENIQRQRTNNSKANPDLLDKEEGVANYLIEILESKKLPIEAVFLEWDDSASDEYKIRPSYVMKQLKNILADRNNRWILESLFKTS